MKKIRLRKCEDVPCMWTSERQVQNKTEIFDKKAKIYENKRGVYGTLNTDGWTPKEAYHLEN